MPPILASVRTRIRPMHILWMAALGCLCPAQAHAAPPSSTAQGMFELYETNRRDGIPHYITEDLLLLAYGLARKLADADHESRRVIPRFRALVDGLERGLSIDAQSPGPVRAANRDFVAILRALLDGDPGRPPSAIAERELALVRAADAIADSPLWGMKMDYTQFVPRGRYTRSEALRGYFRALRYAGGVLFAVVPSAATGVAPEAAARMTAQALALVRLIDADPPLADDFRALNAQLEWRYGAAEDLRNQDLEDAAVGPGEERSARLLALARERRRRPRILAGVVDLGRLEPGLSAADALTGWRLVPQRYAADAAAFQRLIFAATGDYLGGDYLDDPDCADCPPPPTLSLVDGRAVKGYPSGMELLALLGSPAAARAVAEARDDRFAGYAEAAVRARRELERATGAQRAWLRFLRAGAGNAGGDEATTKGRERLNALLGFWTWQRYLTLLYAKQSYTPIAKRLAPPDRPRPGATLEPSPALYRALRTLVEEHRRHDPHPVWDGLAGVLDRCIRIATALRAGRPPDRDQQAFLNRLDKRLLALGLERDRPIVVDVHTNPADGMVLEEGIGYPRAATSGPARGARFRHYEFRQPLAERLTDRAWRARLAGGADARIRGRLVLGFR